MKHHRHIAAALTLVTIAILDSACSTNTLVHDSRPDGSTHDELTTRTLWTDPKITDLDVGASEGDKSRHVKVGTLSADQTSGLKSFNQMLPGLVESAVEGAVKGVSKSIKP